jgi:hypothetical protein
MRRDNSERRSRWPAVATAGALLLHSLFALYMLTTGPVLWLGEHGHITSKLEYAYTGPADWLFDRAPEWFADLYQQYIDWWLDNR